MGPMDTIIANKFIKTLLVAEEPPKGTVRAHEHEHKGNSQPNNTFKMGTELMYGGQGKITSNIKLTSVTATKDNEGSVTNTSNIRTKNGGLDHPRLDDTNEEIMGDGKRKLRKQNKQCKQQLKAAQMQQSRWTEHTGQVAYKSTPLP